MHKRGAIWFFLGTLLVVSLLIWLSREAGPESVSTARREVRGPLHDSAVHSAPNETPQGEVQPSVPVLAAAIPAPDTAETYTPVVLRVQPTAGSDLEQVRGLFTDYRAVFGENPVGSNAEITAALAGKNPKGISFLNTTASPLNERGELLDRWGTPYFFHQLSADEMEIHSAGPDLRRGTSDDLVAR